MKIDRNHIEQVFFDYFEGNLSPSEEKELIDFLKLYPDLYEEFQLYKSLKLNPPALHYPQKDRLKKNIPVISKEELETLFIASAENSLTENEKQWLSNELKFHPEKEKEIQLYYKTKLEPDLSITYSDKAKLKQIPQRAIRNNVRLYWITTVAASILLILTLYINRITNLKEHTGKKLVAISTNKYMLHNKNVTSFSSTKTKHFHQKTVKHYVQSTYKEQKSTLSESEKVEELLVQQKIIVNDTIRQNEPSSIPIEQPLSVEKKSVPSDSILNKSLERLFAQNRFHYFHDMVQEVENEKQVYLPHHESGSLWNVLENGSKKINEITGSNIQIKENEYTDTKQIKHYVRIGNFSFSRTFSQK